MSARTDEFREKERRIHAYLDESGMDAVVIGTQANFSWLSCGGRSSVLITSAESDAIAVIDLARKTLVAYVMDGERNQDEEMAGLGFDLVTTRWDGKSREQIVRDQTGIGRFLSDIALPGAVRRPRDFCRLIYPLTEAETARYRVIAAESESILRSVADRIAPGMAETEVENMLVSAFALKGFVSTVVLVGSDERIPRYRHPVPSQKKIRETVVLVVCPRKHGLHVPLTRMMRFGDRIDRDLESRFAAASTIAATCIARSVPGTRFADIFTTQKRLYRELGFENEWHEHFPGGITGYIPNDSTLSLDPEAAVTEGQAFNWFVTITGVNTEDTCLSRKGSSEILTQAGAWPLTGFDAEGKTVMMPSILSR